MNKTLRKILYAIYPENVTCQYCGSEISGKCINGLCENCCQQIKKLSVQLENYNGVLVYSYAVYEGITRQIVLDAKDSDKPHLTKVIAKFIADVIKESKLDFDVICFVPCTKKNKRQRGYDHMKKCAEFLSEEVNKPILKGLCNIGKNVDQTKLSEESERYENVKDNFIFKGAGAIGRKILLIDDIATSGATLHACVNALRKACPSQIICATFARPYFEKQ